MQKKESNIPKSSLSGNTYKDFNKICRAYYDELMHISKSTTPALSKNDTLILSDLMNEIVTYSNELINLNFIPEAKKILDIGLVISDFLLKIFGEMNEATSSNNLVEKLKFPLSLKLLLLETNFNILFRYESDYANCEKHLTEIIEIQIYLQSSNENQSSAKFYMGIVKYHLNKYDEALKYVIESKNLLENNGNSEKKENNKGKDDNMKVEKISNILNFMAELYRIRNDSKNAISCYENGYYLNLGRIGGKGLNKDYFKKKLDELNEEIKKQNGMEEA